MTPLIAVLAGGSSSRMGSDKAQVLVEGEAMLDRVIAAAGSVGEPQVVGGPHATIEDLRPGRMGPMAGLEAALVHAGGRDVVLLGVDQPFVRPQTLTRLIKLPGDVVVPIDDGWEQVTCAVYRPAMLGVIRAALDEGADPAIHRHLDGVDTTRVAREQWTTWGEDGRSWFSVDTPEALAIGIEKFG